MKAQCLTNLNITLTAPALAIAIKTDGWLLSAAVAVASFLAPNLATAAKTQIEVDEGGFANWSIGAAHQASGILPEEANDLGARGLFGTNYMPGTFEISLLRPETAGNTQANTGEVDASLVFVASGNILSGFSQSRGLDILDPASEGHGLSNTILWTWSSVGLTGNQVKLSVKYNTNSLTDYITTLTGPSGNKVTESGKNDSVGVLDPYFLPNHPAFAGIAADDINIVFRSDVAVPEPSTAVLSLLSLGLCGFTRLRARVDQR